MGRTARDSKLETRTARLRLAAGKRHRRGLEPGLVLIYRRPASGPGSWSALLIDRPKPDVLRRLGAADDFSDADGKVILTFAHAQTAARAVAADARKAQSTGAPVRRGPYRVADAVADYLADYRREGKRDLKNTESIVRLHILPALGGIDTAALTTARIRDWHRGLAAAAPIRRTRVTPAPKPRNFKKPRPAKPARKAFDSSDPEAMRRRKSRANRILTVLKAALNFAYREEKLASDSAWRRVEPFESVDVPRLRYLTEQEARRLVENCQPHAFRALVEAALLTGARYGELARANVGDLDAGASTLLLRETKAGKPRYVRLTQEGRALFALLADGREANAPLLTDAAGNRWKASRQARPLRQACERAGISPPITFHGLRDTFASHLALRGVGLQVIAKLLGHADSRITEKHYAHLSNSHVAEQLVAHGLRLTPDA